jgi:hypothetical protein
MVVVIADKRNPCPDIGWQASEGVDSSQRRMMTRNRATGYHR